MTVKKLKNPLILNVMLVFMLIPGLLYDVAGAESMETSIEELQLVMPAVLSGWQLQEQVIYDSSSLYEYINGGAELYHSYGFNRLLNLRYEDPGQMERDRRCVVIARRS